MYRVIKDRLERRGIQIIEEKLKQSLGFCELGVTKPIIHIEKNLDEMNKIGVLLHEAVHASSYWTKRKWWMYYRATGAKSYMYMEETLALQKQIELSIVFNLHDTYSTELASGLLDTGYKYLGEVSKLKVEKEFEPVDSWLLNTFKGIDNAFDRHLYKTATISSNNHYRNLFC